MVGFCPGGILSQSQPFKVNVEHHPTFNIWYNTYPSDRNQTIFCVNTLDWFTNNQGAYRVLDIDQVPKKVLEIDRKVLEIERFN